MISVIVNCNVMNVYDSVEACECNAFLSFNVFSLFVISVFMI